MLAIVIIVFNVEGKDNLAIVPFEKDKRIRVGKSWKRGRLAKNVGHRKIFDKQEKGSRKLVKGLLLFFHNEVLILELSRYWKF